ncbi:MAG: flavodoxin-dependent (E)-4-hydroxy-3-methylbut-2-enyl-diphosphate synthase [Lachnospiraceae bacterium]|nr:flavodoxin-dependent (E)-4-hydroxy-3-methylbut-2-enyl-diphosphate synthase [Lachnospiraceae bacterium]
MTDRDHTRKVRIGDRVIGGGAPILIQSMTNTRTEDTEGTVAQILRLEKAGCEIVRCTVPTEEAASSVREIKKKIHIPLVADIHFDHRMALLAIEAGADKVRINPGNIGGPEKLKEVVREALDHGVPIRVGVNGGSLEKDILERYGGVTAEGLAESAMQKVQMVEDAGLSDIVISVKSSDVLLCADAYRLIAERTDHPLHIGVTEAGTVWSGNIKSALGLGIMLERGLGDTLRVSLTGDPLEEIRTAKLILKAMHLREGGAEIISCPTCGRTRIDLDKLSREVEKALEECTKNIRVAVMGCAVNGPGEAREADIGVAGGDGEGLIFKKGEILRKVPEEGLLKALLEEIDSLEE